jgi:hypothetical protein
VHLLSLPRRNRRSARSGSGAWFSVAVTAPASAQPCQVKAPAGQRCRPRRAVLGAARRRGQLRCRRGHRARALRARHRLRRDVAVALRTAHRASGFRTLHPLQQVWQHPDVSAVRRGSFRLSSCLSPPAWPHGQAERTRGRTAAPAVAAAEAVVVMDHPRGPSGRQPKRWDRPGVWTIPARIAAEPRPAASTTGSLPPTRMVWPSWVPTRAVMPTVLAWARVPVARATSHPPVAPAGVHVARTAMSRASAPVDASGPSRASCSGAGREGWRTAIAMAGAVSVSRFTNSSWRALSGEWPSMTEPATAVGAQRPIRGARRHQVHIAGSGPHRCSFAEVIVVRDGRHEPRSAAPSSGRVGDAGLELASRSDGRSVVVAKQQCLDRAAQSAIWLAIRGEGHRDRGHERDTRRAPE